MEYEELKQWLDWHVDSLRDQRDHAAFNSQIETTESRAWIQLYRGIELAADLMGLTLLHEVREDQEYPHWYSFWYRETEFVQMGEEPLPEGKEG